MPLHVISLMKILLLPIITRLCLLGFLREKFKQFPTSPFQNLSRINVFTIAYSPVLAFWYVNLLFLQTQRSRGEPRRFQLFLKVLKIDQVQSKKILVDVVHRTILFMYHRMQMLQRYTTLGVSLKSTQAQNISTVHLRQWGFQQYLPFSWATLRGKHFRHPIAFMGVVDTFGHCKDF